MTSAATVAFARQLIDAPSEETTKRLFDGVDGFFWVDWREDDHRIVSMAAQSLGLAELRPERRGADLSIAFGDKTYPVPLRGNGGDRDVTLVALNQAIAPDYEVRFARASDGGDTLAFLALRRSVWEAFAKQFGPRVDEAFGRVEPGTPIFGDGAPLAPEVRDSIRHQMRHVRFARAYPRLCTSAQAAGLAAGIEEKGGRPFSVPFAGDLVLTYFLDLTPTFPTASQEDLAAFGITRDEVHAIARSNARKAQIRQFKVLEHDGITELVGSGVVGGIPMMAAIAIDAGTWDQLEKFDGQLVAAFPLHGRVLSAPAANPAAIAVLRKELAAIDFTDPLAISPQIFLREQGRWTPLPA